jgi:glycosyltransferase involved in cell wall biosynthesis
LDSVIAQTLPAHEIIVCNDGSADDTAEVLAHYLARYSDQILVINQENQGVSGAINTAGRRSTGDWVVLLGADDEWLPARLERIADAIAENPSADIVTTDAIVRSSNRQDFNWYSKTPWPSRPDHQPAAIIAGSFIFGEAAVRRAAMDRIGWFRVDLPQQGEWEGWVRLVLTGSRAACVNEPLAIYHQGGPGQLSRNRIGTYQTMLAVLEAEEGKYGAELDAAIARSKALARRRLHTALGVAAVRRHDRKGCLRAASDPALHPVMRLKFAAAALIPSFAARRLG